ncbi:MAG: hypothetical protein AAFQ67_04635 [Pseudomonadota bacterium]
MLNLRFSLGVLALGAAACASQSIDRPALYVDRTGYTIGQVEDNRFYVTFSGKPDTPKTQVYRAALKRAALTTQDAGFDWFEIRGTMIDARRRANPFAGAFQGAGGGELAGQAAGIVVEFSTGRGEAPDDPDRTIFHPNYVIEDVDAVIANLPPGWDYQ